MSLSTLYKRDIKPLNDELERMIYKPHLAVDDDFTVIPVSIKKNGETVRVIENGILLECYHEKVENNNCLACGEYVE